MPIKREDEISRRTRDLYERALSALDRKNYDVAIDMLLEALAVEPEFLQAHKVLRATQIKKFGGTGKTASSYLKKGLAVFTGMPTWAIGGTQLGSKPREALISAYKMLSQDPTSLQGLDLLIRAAQKLELPEVAVLGAEAAVAAYPKSISFLGTLADLYRQADMPSKAQDVYERMLELRPNDPDILREMKDITTLVHMKGSKIEEAQSYRDMIRDTKEAVNLEQEGKVVRSEEMINNLIEETKKRLEEQPNNITLIRKLADYYQQKGDFDTAQSFLEQAMGSEGGDPSLERALGEVKIRRIDTQLKALQATLSSNPDDETAKTQVAEWQEKRKALLLEESEKRVRRYPNDMSFRFELAILYYQAGRVTEALQEFQMAQRSPQHRIQSLNYLGLCFRNQKLFDLAVNQFQKAEKESVLMDNNKKDIIYNLGTTFEQMARKTEALEHFKKIYEVDINYRDVSKKIMELSQG